MIRNAHPSNHRCADCTHISKVRSLTLDVKSFTIDIVELLLQIGNNVGNSVWEGRLDLSLKPITTSSREERLEFITAKYSHRAYVQPLSPTLSRYATADEVLLASIKKSDIQGVLYAIALGANLNATDRSRGTHVFFLALAAADPAVPSLTVNTTNPNAGSSASLPGDTRSVSFPIAELLVQNGANVPPELPSITLSAAAQAYYTQKSLKAARTTPISPTRLGSSSGTNATRRIHPSNSTAARVENLGSSAHFSSSGEGKEREKAHKRGSAGARFAGKVASLGLDR
ncbi:hypothetical protein KEM55_005969 [Ascosphaera atra]|nr:hypothetical protein KEM55_005969 [Ascosphaera atra]